MTTFSGPTGMKASEYSGPFESLYEEHEALQGNRGHRAAYVASQAQGSRSLREKGLPDNTIFGTSRDLFGRDRFETQDKNPKSNYRAYTPQVYNYTEQFSFPAQAPSSGGIKVPLEGGGTTLKPRSRPYPEGGFFPSLAGPGPKDNPQGFIETMAQSGPGMREAFGMGLANIASGGAFSSDPNVKMRKFLEQGFSPQQAQDYINATERTNARLEQERFLYGDRVNERGGTQGTQATAATGEVDPTADPNYIPPHLRYLMEQREAVANMNMGGLMALGPMMQQQQYEMGRQMAMRDMGVSV